MVPTPCWRRLSLAGSCARAKVPAGQWPRGLYAWGAMGLRACARPPAVRIVFFVAFFVYRMHVLCATFCPSAAPAPGRAQATHTRREQKRSRERDCCGELGLD